ncbi:probable catabolite repression protein creC [Oryza brachyantha]|uniref:Uncharacterized protein n=1 Tax=Oryza brachyantha TaxID=4533 RepID=J3N6E7_ORYBR|nr:probable catabolite repression protein creC [Oryza brachyantha]
MTVAYLEEKPATRLAPSTASFASGIRSVAARLLGAGNGSRPLSFVGSNGASGQSGSGSSRPGRPQAVGNYDGKGTYIIYSIAHKLFISDFNSNVNRPIKYIRFSNSGPLCHAFDSEAKDGHDLIVGLSSGDVCSMSLRQQLKDPGHEPIEPQHFINNKYKEGITNSRCTGVAWVPGHKGLFVVSDADGNLYVYDKSKDVNTDWTFPTVEDRSEIMISHAKSSKSNPVARWHICQGAINAISFSPDGAYLATVGRDGYLRVFDFAKEQLIFGGKSYFGSLFCCSWSIDGKYLLSGGEDDLVQVWSMDDRKMVAWGEGHKSWVSAVAFDSYWSPPNSAETEENTNETMENTIYRFASVGQDARLLLWDVAMDELRAPLTSSSSCSPTSSSGRSPSTDWDSTCPPARVLRPSPRMQEVPKLLPLATQPVGADPLSALEFTSESILAICREGRITIWPRPIDSESNNDQQHPD